MTSWLGKANSRRALLVGLSLLFGLVITILAAFAPILVVRVNSAEVRHDEGFAYTVPLGKHSSFFFQLGSDGIDGAYASRLILLEDGKPLGPAHTQHADIRKLGDGRFSHWTHALWFSSSDGTDPGTNGRSYIAEAKLSLWPIWTFAGTAAFAAALLVIAFKAASHLRQHRWQPYAIRLEHSLAVLSRPRQYPTSLVVLIGLFAVVVFSAAVIYGWYDGDTSSTGLAVARFFPVSDAFGYHSCGTSIAAAGKFDEPLGNDWCARRVLYPAMLASLFSLTAWNFQFVLIAQGALVGLTVAAFALTVSSVVGLFAVFVAAVLLFVYAWEFVLGLFMTEVLGFTLGLCGLALLLGFCKTRYFSHLLAGTAFISIALAARAGALFVLPMLLLWALFAFRTSNNSERARFFLVALLGVLAGPLLQFITVSSLGADASNTGGNFSTSLYGLSTGSRDWSQAYHDFEPLFKRNESEAFPQVYAAAWENIKNRPDVFIGALAEAGRSYFGSLFAFVNFYRANELLTALAVLGAIRCLFDLQPPYARLVLALAIAELLAAPLIFDSGGIRVFAVTAPLRILLCALGVQWILQCLASAINRERALSNEAPEAKTSLLLAAGTGAFILFLIVAPVTPLARAARLQAVAGIGCPAGLKEVVARLGRESQSLAIVDTSALVESLDPFQITPQRLLNDSRIAKTWFGKDFLDLAPPLSIVRAVDLSSPTASAVKPLAFAGELPDDDDPHSLCVDEGQHVDIAQVRHHLIKQIRPLGGQR